MKYMVIETFRPGARPLVYERVRQRGRMLPDGLRYLDSWVESDGERCFQLMETDDEKLFETWTAEWSDLVDFEIVPVSDSPARWTCRELTSADQGFLWEMLYLALWDPPDQPRRPRSVLNEPHIRRYVENWGRDEDFGLAAIDPKTGELIGATWLREMPPDEERDYGCPFPEIGIAVKPEFHGQGVGSFLMARLIEGAGQRGAGLRLGVHPQNTPARRLYEKFGFTQFAVGAGGYPQLKLPFD